MLTFELSTEAKMTSGNPRKEKHGSDDGALALDLDFACEVGCENLEQMALGDKYDWGHLYDKDGQVKNIGLKRVVFSREFEDHQISVRIGDRTFALAEVHLKKFAAEPVFGGQVKLTFQAQAHPPEGEIGPILEGLVNGCTLEISGPADDAG